MNTQNNTGGESNGQSIVYITSDMLPSAKSKYQIFPPLTPDEFAALKNSIVQYGVLVPIIMDDEGNVVEGHHRSLVCKELGLSCPAFVRRFTSEAEKMEIAATANGNRRHLTREQKRVVIGDYLRADPQIADNFLGELLSVSKNTVADVRLELEGNLSIDKLTSLRGKDGKMRPREMPKAKKPKPNSPKPKPSQSAKKKSTAHAADVVDDHGMEEDHAAANFGQEHDDAEETENGERSGTGYKVSWQRVASGQVVITALDPDSAARKVRAMAEQETTLDIKSGCRPNVDVMQVEDAATGKVVAVSHLGDLGQPTKAPTASAPTMMTDRIGNGFVVMVEVQGKLVYKTQDHEDKKWFIVAQDERAAKLAVEGCVPKPVSEHTKAMGNMPASTAGVCFVTANDDGTLARDFILWNDL